ncbi:MAG TPA: hypothetical protein VJI68_02415 [Candidatus Nanoarchaeia archaeon]|nr:hypothetical protein [Candidatus Nanoarchaeia archaeon]
MTKSINVKVENETWEAMKTHEEINWSGVIRNTIKNKLKELEERKFDKNKAKNAFLESEKIIKEKVFKGKSGVEIIREWRDKRK